VGIRIGIVGSWNHERFLEKMFRQMTLVLVGCVASVSLGQSLIEAEHLMFSPPKDFIVGYKASHDNYFITEFVHTGQTVDDWTEIVTMQIWRHETVDPASFLQGIGGRYKKDCPGAEVDGGGIHTGQVNGYAISMLVLRCPNNPSTAKLETTVFRVIQGNDALYSVQYAWRSVPSDQELKDALHLLANATVCDTRTPGHPCPALDSVIPSK
jgi:hypothetical protein